MPALDSQLTQLVEQAMAVPALELAGRVAMSIGESIPVSIRYDGLANDIEAALSQLLIQPANRGVGVIKAYVPISLLRQIASLGAVRQVQLIEPWSEDAISEGYTVHQAATWHGGGRTGAGVKVGIVDAGFQGLLGLLGTELPASVTARCYTAVGVFTSSASACDAASPHGTAVAEAIFDLAPGVSLYIATPMSALDLRNSVDWMTSQGVRVINQSLSWTWTGPGDGTSPYTDAPVRTMGLIRIGGHLSYGGYDVQTDGRHTEAPRAAPVH